ncbi:V-type ATP synthase subunit E [Croceitalea dokdonensis DOKDO 023]|uniref:V-type ATP synthase subunit E n=1 Tax=Croceitalea dokdonensis DOKDO 023 TaxID=1300341 RepID=A0A0P7AZ94_9FLAO|nr:hypothetical protein [Croceitalea dokdonensis]KPM30879.1 V-type ATP synthase subunit E [Croceitalea dokdonensis DOKDO 023]
MSEKTLDKLIATLKTEAIEAADKEAGQIVEQARTQAQKILKEAEVKKDELFGKAKKEAQATREKGEAALKQAARDVTVSVRNDLLKLFKAALEREVDANFSPDFMEKAILKVVENVGSGAALKLPEGMEGKLADKIQKRLQESDNLEAITKDASLPNGFVINKTDQGWSYHISPEEVAELLNEHLSPKWVDILTNESDT